MAARLLADRKTVQAPVRAVLGAGQSDGEKEAPLGGAQRVRRRAAACGGGKRGRQNQARADTP